MTHSLPSGTQIRLRLPHRSDAAGVAELCRRMGLGIDEVEARRLLRFDPRERAVACAVAWTGECETLVGVGATDLTGQAPPDLVLADPEHSGLGTFLERRLAEMAATRARRAA